MMNNLGLVAAVGVVIFVLCVLLIVLVYLIVVLKRKQAARHKNVEKRRTVNPKRQSARISNVNGNVAEDAVDVASPDNVHPDISIVVTEPPADDQADIPQPENTFIENDRLEKYTIEKMAETDAFKMEYLELPRDLYKPCEVGQRANNVLKNRYRNIIAYDADRVVLDTLEGSPDSDYINASYIDGYDNKQRHYVASQGPKKETVNDMWRMIWELKVNCVIKLTPLVESGKQMVAQYWPEEGKEEDYGGMIVTSVKQNMYAHFILRVFKITHQEESHTVRQLQYTLWPDKDIPEYIFPLLQFRKRMKSFEETSTGPILIHCSAGVGRTGAFIAIDYLIEQAKAEGGIDVFQCVKKLREQRTIMVQTLRQYIFIHEAVAEWLRVGDTVISCEDLPDVYKNLSEETGEYMNTNKKAEQYQLLREITRAVPRDNIEPSSEDENKNRDPDIIATFRHRPFLAHIEGGSSYINAVYVSVSGLLPPIAKERSYKRPLGFIVTQLPLANTITDFWRLVFDNNINSIILVDSVPADDDYPAFWTKDSALELDYLTVTPEQEGDLKESSVSGCVSTLLTVTSQKKQDSPLKVQQWEIQCWPSEDENPPNVLKSTMIKLLQTVEKRQKEHGETPVLVVCKDGARRCGLVCGSSWQLDMMSVEQKVDVFNTIRYLRIPRQQLIPTEAQYTFLYELALEYFEQTHTYENFGAGGQMSSIL